MPTLSEFFGIVIRMYWNDHNPPHFHAYYAVYAAQIRIDTLEVIKGSLPPRALGLVREWAAAHRDELATAWADCYAGRLTKRIAPLE